MFHRLLQWVVLDLNSTQVSLRSLSSQLFFYSLQKTQLFPFFLDRKMVMKDSISFTDGQGGSLGLLVVIVPSSLRPIRRFCYGNFYIIQCAASFHPNYANLDFTPSMLSFIVFFVTICYHTIQEISFMRNIKPRPSAGQSGRLMYTASSVTIL